MYRRDERIKIEKIDDAKKVEHAKHEEKQLFEKLSELKLDEIDQFLQQLIKVNSELWEIEDLIREEERAKDFGEKFIELALLERVSIQNCPTRLPTQDGTA